MDEFASLERRELMEEHGIVIRPRGKPAFVRPTTKAGRQDLFLKNFRRKLTIGGACKASQVSRVLVYNWLKQDPAFAQRYQQTLDDSVDDLIETVAEAAVRTGDYRAALKIIGAHRPEYREQQPQVNVQGGADTKIMVVYDEAPKGVQREFVPRERLPETQQLLIGVSQDE